MALLFAYDLQIQQDQECNNTGIKAQEKISWISPNFPDENFSITLIC